MDLLREVMLVVPRFSAVPSEIFRMWKLSMEAILETKYCFGIITGEEQQPKYRDDNSEVVTKLHDFEKSKSKTSAVLIICLRYKFMKSRKSISGFPLKCVLSFAQDMQVKRKVKNPAYLLQSSA